MRKFSCTLVLAVAVLAWLPAAPASAQDNGAVVALGWAPAGVWGAGDNVFVPFGLDANASIPMTSNVHLFADLGYNHKYSVDLFDLAFGARYMIPSAQSDNISPFAEGLFGIGHVGVEGATGTGVVFGFGAGADLKAVQAVNFRVEAQYLRYQVSGFGANEIRFILGVSKRIRR